MNTETRELTGRQMEAARGGAYINNRRADGVWEFPVIDPDGNVAATFSDVVDATDYCMYNSLDSIPSFRQEAEMRRKEAQHRREHGLPARTMYETVYDIWLSPR